MGGTTTSRAIFPEKRWAVGGKRASLGEMDGKPIPEGITALPGLPMKRMYAGNKRNGINP